MCILFLYTGNNEGESSISKTKTLSSSCPYKLILASNRDGCFKRPSKKADFWNPDNPNIIGGQDLEPGKEGGTWLAMSKQGKIGALLNILSAPKCDGKTGSGRGFLVKEYLLDQNSEEIYSEFFRQLEEKREQYDPFSLIMINAASPNGPTVNYFTNATAAAGASQTPESSKTNKYQNPINLSETQSSIGNFYAFGNSLYLTPFKKVKTGKEELKKIVEKSMNFNKGILIEKLLALLRSSEKYYPDEQLQKQGSHISENYLSVLSSRFVHTPAAAYGTRTQTIILIDHNNFVEFHEWTLDPETPTTNIDSLKWIYSSFEFNMEIKNA